MKNKFLLAGIGLLFLASCATDMDEDIAAISISPSSATVPVDRALPPLTLTSTPADYLDGKTVIWTSSEPEIISVDDGGVLSFATDDIEESAKDVVITATVGKNTASCTITVQGLISKYGIISDAALPFDILDRNVGANSTSEPGSYFQWGRAEAVKPSTVDPKWSSSSTGWTDWSIAGNSPCPKGWEPINESHMDQLAQNVCDIITDYESDPEFAIATEDEYKAAKALWESMHFVPGGYIDPASGLTERSSLYLWFTWTKIKVSNADNAMFITDLALPVIDRKTVPHSYALNIRCVRAH